MSATARSLAAVRAAKNRRRWGAYATQRFAEKRGVPLGMYAMAIVFEARRRELREALS